jgi:hypothetical protein
MFMLVSVTMGLINPPVGVCPYLTYRRNVERTALVFSGGTRRAGFLCYFLGLSIGISFLIDV